MLMSGGAGDFRIMQWDCNRATESDDSGSACVASFRGHSQAVFSLDIPKKVTVQTESHTVVVCQ